MFSQIALFFSKMALVTFGGAYAVLAYVAQQAVEHYHWLQPREMLDGLGMAETTPGPLIMVLQFVGFMAAFRDPGTLSPMLAGTLGGLLATWVTFTPCFLWIFLGAPFIETLRGNKGLAGALGRDHRRRGRRDPQSLDLVRAAHAVPGDHAGSLVRAVVRHARVVEHRYSRRWCWRSQPRPRSSASTSACSGCWAGSCAAGVAAAAGRDDLNGAYTISAGASLQASLLASTCSVAWWMLKRCDSSSQT